MKIQLTHTLLPAAFIAASMASLSAQSEQPTGIQDTTPIAVNYGAGYNYKYDGWYNLAAGPNGRVVDGVDYAYDWTDAANKPGFTGNTGYPSAMNASPAYPNPIYSQLNSATVYALSTPGYSATYAPDSPASSRAAFNKVANGNGSAASINSTQMERATAPPGAAAVLALCLRAVRSMRFPSATHSTPAAALWVFSKPTRWTA